jgi:hypothetical protein
MRSLHALRARVTGTVKTSDSVESSSIDADSASILLLPAQLLEQVPTKELAFWLARPRM